MSYFKSNTTSKIKLTKQELSYFPFSDYANVGLSELEDVAKEHGLTNYASWLVPQMLGFFGKMKTFKNDEGDYEALPFLEHNIGTDPFKQGLWKVAARLKRGQLIKGQNTSTGAQYSALVPLILAALKRDQKINYSEWTQKSIPLLVDSLLADAMLVPPDDIPTLTNERIMELRVKGLTTMSGASAGEIVGPTKKWSLTGIKDTELGHLPTHAVTMICQTWVAHPSLRTSLMVLDPNDWDGMPEPLVDTMVLEEPVRSQGSKKFLSMEARTDRPWL